MKQNIQFGLGLEPGIEHSKKNEKEMARFLLKQFF